MKIKNNNVGSLNDILKQVDRKIFDIVLNTEYIDLIESIIFDRKYKGYDLECPKEIKDQYIYQWLKISINR